MPNLSGVLKDVIRRVAKREVQSGTELTRRATAQFRRAIASLKRQIAALTRRLAATEKRLPSESPISAPAELPENSRFRAQGVAAHRRRLGLSARDYGKLVGVDGQTIYLWERGASRPRLAQRARLLAVRALGKRAALEQLGKTGKEIRKRGTFARSGLDSILALLKAQKALSTAEINRAWREEGRAGVANGALGLLVKSRKVKRVHVKGERGSRYSLA